MGNSVVQYSASGISLYSDRVFWHTHLHFFLSFRHHIDYYEIQYPCPLLCCDLWLGLGYGIFLWCIMQTLTKQSIILSHAHTQGTFIFQYCVNTIVYMMNMAEIQYNW